MKDDLVREIQAIHSSHLCNPVSAFFSYNEDLFVQMDVFYSDSLRQLNGVPVMHVHKKKEKEKRKQNKTQTTPN